MQRIFKASIILLFTALPIAFAQDADKINVTATELNKNTYMLATNVGGNLALCVGDEGVILVDSEYEQLNEKVREAVSRISDNPVKYIINTHWHFDHVDGNRSFAESGSTIIAHENVRNRMAEDQHLAVLEYDVPASPEEALPVITFTNKFTFHLKNETVTVTHIPNAHTDGDAIVHFKNANVVHTGDIFFNCGYPFIDVSSGGGIDGMIDAVQTILSLCDAQTRIIPGHGPLAAKADLEKYLALLSDFRSLIAKEIKAGKDLEKILTEQPTAALDEKWGKRFFSPQQFTEIVYLSLLPK